MSDETEYPSFKKWQVGDVVVTRIQEGLTRRVPPNVMIQATMEMILKHDWLQPDYVTSDGFLLSNSQAFIIESRGKRIMVDTCVGNDKPRPLPFFNMLKTPFFEHLSLAGFAPEMIDFVLCTHLHFDHIGWNTRLVEGKWVPSFPNAQYLFARVEYEHTLADPRLEDDRSVSDSIRPVLDCGLAQLVELDHHITDEVWFEPTPGHTPGHCAVRISSGGQEAVITGDLMHHPLQASEPGICSTFCFDEQLARNTRRTFLTRLQGSDTIVLGSHFSGPTGVHVRSHGTAWRMEEARAQAWEDRSARPSGKNGEL